MKTEKERILARVADAIDNQRHLILMIDTGAETMLGLQGDPKNLSLLVVRAMRQDKQFANVFGAGVYAFDSHNEKKSKVRDELMELIKSLIGFKPLDCENCPVKDHCEVRDEIHCEKEMPKDLLDMLNEVFKSIKEDDK